MVIFGQETTPKRLLLIIGVCIWIGLSIYNFPMVSADPKWIGAPFLFVVAVTAFSSAVILAVVALAGGFVFIILRDMWTASGPTPQSVETERQSSVRLDTSVSTSVSDGNRKMDI